MLLKIQVCRDVMQGHWVRHSEGTTMPQGVGQYSPNNAASHLKGP